MVNLYRNLPNFKGKYKLGSFLFSLPKTDVERECLETVDMRDGSKILVDLRCPTERKAYFTGQYDYSIIQRLSKVLKTGSTVLDVGANIGFYTIALGHDSRKASKEYSIYAFEPVKANFDRLAHNLNMNGLSHQNIHIFNLALGNQEGQIKLQIGSASESSPTNNAIWIKDEVQEPKCSTCTSEITKLDIFAQQNKVQACDLIKVDIEGAELEFFLGGRNFINKYRPIIWSEFNPYHANRFGYSFREISDLASNWGYDLYKQKKP
ncbi:MAG: FkbM family methyltransferase [Hydrococcus sp. SU_1_0]|nr:FkbM family methyltransferase [Hydrococcus sp. SU_1_0]